MKLAIKGHEKRGAEVIALLEMLGGINNSNLYGDLKDVYYFISNFNDIDASSLSEDVNSKQYLLRQYLLYSLEEFEKKFPFKIGDKVFFKNDPEDVHHIIKMEWDDCYCEVRYVIKSVKNGEVDKIHWLAEYLELYREISKDPLPSKEEIRYTHVWEVNGTLVVADNIDEAMAIYRAKEKINEIQSVKKFTTAPRGAAYIKITKHE